MGQVKGLRLPKLISDGMILQRDQDIKIWGAAAEGEEVTVSFAGGTYKTVGDSCGKWEVILPPIAAGGPYEMVIEANQKVVIKDILMGDLWLCGGQSNMELPINRVMERYKEEVESYENPMIRMFHVPLRYEFNTPLEDFEEGCWQVLNQKNVLDFTALGYFFAKELFNKYHVPIGLIQTAVGGTLVQTWMSEEALKEFPIYLEQMAKYKDDDCVKKVLEDDAKRIGSWYNKLNALDLGMNQEGCNWSDVHYEAKDWKRYEMPNFLRDETLPEAGAIWFRKEVEVPEHLAGKAGRLLLGTIVDNDVAYINGVQVGTTAYKYPPRIYPVSQGVLKSGKNVIVVRVCFESKEVGLTPGKICGIEVGDAFIGLEGEWQYKVGAQMVELEPQTFLQYEPAGLYNGMLYPIKNMRLKGVIWYQGESNTHKTEDYKALCEGLIKNWRSTWERADLPFIYVQLPNFATVSADYYDVQEGGSNEKHACMREEDLNDGWAKIRQAQLETLEVPNTAMVVAIDTGEWNDLHPLNKKDIGERLAKAARAIAYDEDIVYSSPIATKARVEDNKAIISFAHAGKGLVARGQQLNQFIISADGIDFYKAEAEIKENEVIVWREGMTNPVEVRYAWAGNPEGANLYNSEGLPASPFRIKIS